MIFEAHIRDGRDVLVTADRRGFISDGRRERLQALGRTHIVTPQELQQIAAEKALEELYR